MDRIKVLIVDDQEDFSMPFKGWLEATREFLVETIDYGGDTVQRALEFEPDLIILDLDLKKDAEIGDFCRSDGEVIASVVKKRHVELSHIPVLILTQWKDIDEAAELTTKHESDGIFYMSKSDLELRRLAFIGNILFRSWAQ